MQERLHERMHFSTSYPYLVTAHPILYLLLARANEETGSEKHFERTTLSLLRERRFSHESLLVLEES